MNRTISYDIDSHSEGLRVEQFLRRKGYSAQNLSTIKRMPESILVNGVHYYMKQTLKAGDRLLVRIQETESSRNIPPVCAPLSVVYEDEDLIVINKPAGMPIHPSLVDMGITPHIPTQNRTCAINAYGFSLYIWYSICKTNSL